MDALRQFGALLWKNVIVRKRSPMILVLELLWPVIIFVGVVLMRQGSPPTEHSTCSYPERSLPSAGFVPFIQSSVCTINNECKSAKSIHKKETAQARLQALVADLGPVLQKTSTLEAIRALPTVNVMVQGLNNLTQGTNMQQLDEKLKLQNLFTNPEEVIHILTAKYGVLSDAAARALMNSTLNIAQLLEISGVVDFKSIVCDPKQLQNYIIFSGETDISKVSHDLCAIHDDMISTITNDLMKQLDIANIIRVGELFANMTGAFDYGLLLRDVADLMDVSMKTRLSRLVNLNGIPSVLRQISSFIPHLIDLENVDFNRILDIYSIIEPMMEALLNDTGIPTAITELIHGAAVMTEGDLDLETMMKQLMSLMNGTSVDPGLQVVLNELANLPLTSIYPILNSIMNSTGLSLEDLDMEKMMATMGTLMEDTFGESTANMMVMLEDKAMDMMEDAMTYFLEMNNNLETTLAKSEYFKPAMATIMDYGLDNSLDFLKTVIDTENVYKIITKETSMEAVCLESLESIKESMPAYTVDRFQTQVCNPALTAEIDGVLTNSGYQAMLDKMNSSMKVMDLMMQGDVTTATNKTMADMYKRLNETMTWISSNMTDMEAAWEKMLGPTIMQYSSEWYQLGNAYVLEANVYLGVISMGKVMETSDTNIWNSFGMVIQMTDAVLQSATTLVKDVDNMTRPGSQLGNFVQHLHAMPELLQAVYDHINMSLQNDNPPKSDIMTFMCMDLSVKSLSQDAVAAQNFLCHTNWTDLVLDSALTFDPLKLMANVEKSFNNNFDMGIDWFRMKDNIGHTVRLVAYPGQYGPVQLLTQAEDSLWSTLQLIEDLIPHLTPEQIINNKWIFEMVDHSLQGEPMWTAAKHMINLDAAASRLLHTFLEHSKDANFSMLEYIGRFSPTLRDQLANMTSVSPEILEAITQQLMKPQDLLGLLIGTDYTNLCVDAGSIIRLLGLDGVATATKFEKELCAMDWEMILNEVYEDSDFKIVLMELELLMSFNTTSFPPITLNWSDVLTTLTQTSSDLMTFMAPNFTPEMLGLNMSLGNLASVLANMENFNISQIMGALTMITPILSGGDESLVSLMLRAQHQVAYISYHFMVFANKHLTNFNNMRVIDIQSYIGSEEMNKLFAVMQNSGDMNLFLMHNLRQYMQNQQKMSQLGMVDIANVCNSSSPVFGELFSLPANFPMTLVEVQQQTCGVNLNFTKLMEELSVGLDGFGEFLNSLMSASTDFTPISYEMLQYLVEENIRLVTGLATDPPTFTLPLSDPDGTMTQLQQQMQELLEFLNSTYAQPVMSAGDLESQVYQLMSSLQAIGPEGDRFLRVGQTYLWVLAHMTDQLQAQILNPVPGTSLYPEMRKLWVLVEHMPEIISVLVYNMATNNQKVSSLVEGLMTGAACYSDPSQLLVVPAIIDLDLGEVLQGVCSVNITALGEELMELTQTQMISEMYAGLANSTHIANLTEITQNAQHLMASISDLMAAPEVPRFLDPSIWNSSLYVLGSLDMAGNSTAEILPDIQEQILTGLISLQTSVPQLNGMFHVISIYVAVVQDMVNKGIDLSVDPAQMLTDYPELSKLWSLMQFLPEVAQTFTYTSMNENHKISVFLESLMQGVESLCMRNPADLMTTPPDSDFNFSDWFNGFCSINMTALEMEYQNISRTQQISEAYVNLWNSTASPDMAELMSAVEKLMTSLSQPTTLPRLFSDSVWMNALEMVSQYLMNSSLTNTQIGSVGGLESQLYQLMTSLQASGPEGDHFLQVGQTYLWVLAHMTDQLQNQILNPAPGTSPYPEMRRLWVLVEHMPEIISVLVYNMATNNQKVSSFIEGLITGAVCYSDSSKLLVVPASTDLDLGEVLQGVCSVNVTALGEELMELTQTQLISEMYAGFANSTETANLTEITKNAQHLMASISGLMNQTQVPRFLDPTIWNSSLHALGSLDMDGNSTAEILPAIQEQILTGLISLQTSVPQLNGMFHVISIYVAVVQDMVSKGIALNVDPAQMFTDYPELTKLWSLIQYLPEVAQTFTYTSVNDNHKISVFLESLMQGVESLCMRNPADLMTTPPDSDFNFSDWFNGFCSINMAALEMEYQNISRTQQISEAYVNLWNSTASPDMAELMSAVEKLMTSISQPTTLPRLFNDSVWINALEIVSQYLMSSSSSGTGTPTDLNALLGGSPGEINKVLATMDIVMDLVIGSFNSSSDVEQQPLYPMDIISIIEALTNITHILEADVSNLPNQNSNTLDQDKLHEVFQDPKLLMTLCTEGTLSQYITLPGQDMAISTNLAQVICVQPQYLANVLRHAQTMETFVEKVEAIWSSPSVLVDLEALGRKVETLVTMMGTMTEMSPEEFGGMLINMLSAVSTRPLLVSALESVLNPLSNSSDFQMAIVQVNMVADFAHRLKDMMKSGILEDSEMITSLLNMWTSIDGWYDKITYAEFRDSMAWYSSIAEVISFVCSKENLASMVPYVITSRPLTDLSTILCGVEGHLWLDTLLTNNYTDQDIRNIHGLFMYVAGMPYTRSWQQLPDALLSLTRSVSLMNMSSIEDFVQQLGPTLESNQQLLLDNSQQGLIMFLRQLDSDGVLDEIKDVLEVVLAAEKFLYHQIQTFSDSNTTLSLTDMLPNPEAFAQLLQSMVGMDTASALMVATLHPQKFIGLIISNTLNDTVCNETLFLATFTFPEGVDGSQIQRDLCRLTLAEKAQLETMLNQIEAVKFFEELQSAALNGTQSENVWHDLLYYTELILRRVLTLGEVNPAGLDSWLQPILQALEMLGGNNIGAEIATCHTTMTYLQQTSMYLSIQPVLDTLTNFMAMSNAFMTVQLELNSAICQGQYANLSALVHRLNNDHIPEKLQWIAEKFMGDTTDISFTCDTLVTSTNSLTSQLEAAFGMIANQSQPSLTECITETIMASEGLISDISKLLTFGKDMLMVLNDPNLKKFLETITGSPEILKLIEEFIQAANQQQDTLGMLQESLQKNLTTIESFFEESYNIGQKSLMALLNLTDVDMKNLTSEALLAGVCEGDLLNVLQLDNQTMPLVLSLCGDERKLAATLADKLLNFVQLSSQLQDPSFDPGMFWVNLNRDVSELFSHIEGLTELADVLTKLQSIDLATFQNSGELLRTMQLLLTDSSPDALLASFNKVLDNFEGTSTDSVISDIRMMADGIFAFQSLRRLMVDNIQIKDLVKDPAVFRAYLTGILALDAQVADAILDGSLSFEMLLNSSQQDLTKWVCNSTQLASLLTKPHANGVDAHYLSEKFCALDNQTVTQILEELMQQLDVGDLVRDMVTNNMFAVLRSHNITQEQSQASMKALKAASTDLQAIMKQFDNYTASIPNAVASLASAQKGSADMSTLTALLCGDALPEVKDEFNIVQSLPDTDLTASQHREMNELPHDSCRKMYRDIMSKTEGPIVWAFLKPLLLGKIFYTPNTPEIHQLMVKVNSTFADIADIVSIANDWVDGTIVLGDLSDIKTSKIEEILESDVMKSLVSQVGGVSSEDLQDLLYTFSNTNSDLIKGLGNGAGMLVDYMHCLDLNRFVGMDTEVELEREAKKYNMKNEFMAGVVFEHMDASSRGKRAADTTLPPHMSYKIRMDIDNVQHTVRIKERFWRPKPEDEFALDLRYLRGFLQLQDMIDMAIITSHTGVTSFPHVATKQFPFPCHKTDTFVNAFSAYLLPVMMTLAMVAGIAIAVNTLVYDRENGQEETLKAMGMKSGLNWWAWFLVTFIMLALVAFLETIILRYGNIFIYSNMLIIFLYFLDFIFSTLMMVYFVSAFFTRKSLAILATLIVYFISFLPFAVLLSMEVEMKFWQKFLACLSSTTAFSFTSQYIARFEEQQIGMQWDNVKDSPITGDDFSFFWTCMVMLIDGGIYLILGWYVRTVKPGKYGVAAPWYFPVCPSYWGCWNSTDRTSRLSTQDHFSEDVVTDHPVAMSVRGLSKMFGDNTLAVKCLNLNIHCGQVTTLLGHNGAAKTTTMHMLSGILQPTKGEVMVFNQPIRRMKTSIGLCPQHNALFDFMTVKEHMELYSKMKSSTMFSSAKEEVRQLLKDVDLWYCRHSLVRNLSGGMQRRLCVALAFVGGARVVILDEPTSGVDPSGRRAIWNLILRRKADQENRGVGILLSTHHLDEADMISDRVAVLHEGRLLCEGSPIFLKQHLANGHRLTVVGDHTQQGSDPSPLLSLLKRYIPGSRLQQIVGNNMTFVLPSNDASTFSLLFKDIEANLQALHIVSFGISDPTLEEVFLKVCRTGDLGLAITPDSVKGEADTAPDTAQNGDWKQTIDANGSQSSNSLRSKKRETGCGLGLQQFAALLVKRFHHFRRNWRMFLTMLLLPLALFLVANGLYIIRPDDTQAPNRLITTAMYGPDSYVFSKQASTDPLADGILDTYTYSPGLGTSCMNGMEQNPPLKCVQPDAQYSYPSMDMSNNRTCTCDNFKYTCEGKLRPIRERVTPTSEILQDLRDEDIEDYLLTSFTDFIEKRYGGFSFTDDTNQTKSLIWYNNKGHHALPAFYNAYSNGLLRTLMGKNQNLAHQYGISVYNHPFLFNKEQLSRETLLQNAVDAGIAVVVLLAFTFIPVGASMFLVNENVTREKHLQFVSGIGRFTYWMSALVWDLFLVCVAVAISYGILAIFQHASFWDRNNDSAVICMLLLYCWSTLPLVYCTVKLFKVASAAFFTLFCTLIFIGITTMMTMFTLNFFRGEDTGLGEAQRVCSYVFLIFPPYALGGGFIDMITNQVTADIFARFNTDAYIDPFSLELVGWNMIAMAIEGLVFFILVLILESNLYIKCNSNPHYDSDSYEDADVTMERMRIVNGDCKQDMIVVNNLHKVYSSRGRQVHAVNGLTFGVAGNQCFGLLGVNGAGKTTTFNILTGAIQPDGGSARLLGMSLKEGSTNLGHNMGYCPQDEALDMFLSVEEMLFFHAKLKGLVGTDRTEAVNKVIQMLQLDVFKHKVVKSCSGGMKRKLSLAIALLGDPPLMLLDEPTSGMDPKAKRMVWDCLQAAKSNDQAIILTSHSMEECDNLCDQIAIMVNGEFKCLGSSQHLKQKYGQGYTVTLNILGLSTSRSGIYELIQNHFPGASLRDQHRSVVQVDMPRSSMTVSDIYEILEREKAKYNILYYSVSQTTLDTVFVNFAQDQTDNTTVDEVSTDSSSAQYSSDTPSQIATKATMPSYVFSNSAYSMDPDIKPSGNWDKLSTYL